MSSCVWGSVMNITLLSTRNAATTATPASGSEARKTLASESDNCDWLFDAAWAVLGKEPGSALHHITGYPLSSCSAYVAKDPAKRRTPPDHFVRRLIRSRQGGPFLRAYMHGCQAEHWIAIERAERVAAQVDKLNLR